MTNQTNEGRKSLMLEHPEYMDISRAAKRFGVSRPTVIRALLDMVSDEQLAGAIDHMKDRAASRSAQAAQKRRMLTQLADKLDLEQIAQLVTQHA